MTKGALNKIKIKSTRNKDVSHGDHHRVAILELLTPTGLTMEKYRTELDKNLAQIRTQLNSLWQSEGPHPQIPPSPIVRPMLPPVEEAPQAISTIEEGTEAEGEGSSANGHTLSSNNSGKSSLSRRILRRLIPSSVGRKDL